MTNASGGRGRRTWSRFGDVRRRPTPYEVVTGGFHYHFRRDPVPFEMDPEWTLNKWYLAHREGSPFQVADWEDFRDPAALTYRDYVALQHDREVYLDALVDRHEESGSAAALDPGWVDTLRTLFVPLRFPLHVLQMTALYVGQMAPSSYITNCAHFQAADELRRIQRIAYWTRVLADAHGEDLARTATARGAWEDGPAWQPLRRALENLLIAYDWGEAFTALNLAVKPALDVLVDEVFGHLAEANGDGFLTELCTEFGRDARRSREWTRALTGYAVEREPALTGVLDGWVATWRPRADRAVEALADLFTTAPRPLTPTEVTTRVHDTHDAFLAAAHGR
ncbi:ferritin family protein [Streptomyces apricus]|uniref:propane 2-monooxygenase n=1 Tax=Streptomyces apricus TaxID=1828112 RepID=A0A5B0BH63_9ACTN|nr:toluene hydroxylase [Streptomyces apricus]KAA0941504.1 toluene hydroxylase [Streptomyces apricus]